MARLNQTVEQATKRLEEWDAFSVTLSIEALIDDLTNWYVRRSRRRFWRSEQDADKKLAYATLYHVLVKLARLLAPMTPFVAEEMYQNLVVGQFNKAHASVHHTLWPKVDTGAVDEPLITEMGLSARGNANLKVRQPLAKALVHAESGTSQLPNYLTDIVKDELNVKKIEFVGKAGQLVTYRLQPNNTRLGPQFGQDFPKLRAAIEAADAAESKALLDAGEVVTVKIGKETVELTVLDLIVNSQPTEGLAVAADKGVTVGLDTAITPELKSEGLARELVRRIQDLRKKANFNIEDRINTYYQTDGELTAVFSHWADYIKAETLSEQLTAGEASAGAFSEEQKVDGQKVVLGVERRN
jgi:isoleucyl-tRNA synthetase